MKKKAVALVLSILLCITALPVTGMAAEIVSGDAEMAGNTADSQELFSAEKSENMLSPEPTQSRYRHRSRQ